MREPAFWWKTPGIAAWLLAPVALIYGAITGRRMQRTGLHAGIPVICVGNFTLGGTGKTPTAIAIAERLAAQGETPFFLTRGYGGRLAGPVRVDPASHVASDVGDEPLLLARHRPTIVSRDRAAGAVFAKAAGATVIVMDDGLQNPSLHKDLSIAVVDARRGCGNGYVFPAGPLRAPLETQFKKVHAILVVGEGSGANSLVEPARARGCPVMHARLEAAPDTFDDIRGVPVYAFAGIGDPGKFFATLAEAGIRPKVQEPYPDHHPYTEQEAERILARCKAEGLVPVTTEKDIARLSGQDSAHGRLAAAARPIPVTLVLKEPERLLELLRGALQPAL
jgi:tetraacyldisaccharide 4'-kinase